MNTSKTNHCKKIVKGEDLIRVKSLMIVIWLTKSLHSDRIN